MASSSRHHLPFLPTLGPWRSLLVFLGPLIAGWTLSFSAAMAAEHTTAPYGSWENGPPSDPGYFPIAVWLQEPSLAARYQAAGINLYVGLWNGPTDAQLKALKQAGLPVICHQNDLALQHPDRDIIIGWMHGDEPDNAQSLGQGKGYGPPIPTEKIEADYHALQKRDSTRPILLNLGQGVAWDQWVGRGVRRNHPEDYPHYVKGCDIVSFDIYPAVHSHPDVAGKLEFVPKGVDRLRQWTQDAKVIWNCIECSRISNVETKPTPHHVRAEVWMSLIHGSRGLIYFVHQFKPTFSAHALLDDPELLEAVTRLNSQIHRLAPVLNSPSLSEKTTVSSIPAEVPIDIMVKEHEGATYVFAVSMKPDASTGTFQVNGIPGSTRVEVIDEERSIPMANGTFQDRFQGYEVHLYRIR